MPHVGDSGKWHMPVPAACQTEMFLKLGRVYFFAMFFGPPSNARTFKG